MVQVLPAVPTFGSELARVLSEAGANFAKSAEQRRAQTALSNLFAPQQQQSQDQNQSMQGSAIQGSQISPLQQVALAQTAETAYGKPAADALVKAQLEQSKLQEKENIQVRKEGREKEEKQLDELAKLQKTIISGQEAAEVSKANLERMKALIDKDALTSPFGAYLSEATGIPLSLFASPETEEFQKLAAQRGLNVAQAYGMGRILQTEFEQFLKTIPGLLNTKEGKQRIIRTLDYFDNIALNRYDKYKEVLSERKPGQRASDIELKLNESMKPVFKQFGDVLKYGDRLVEVTSSDGTPGKVPANQLEEALSAGYSLREK